MSSDEQTQGSPSPASPQAEETSPRPSAEDTQPTEAGERVETSTTVDPKLLPPPGIDSIIQLFLTQALVAMGIVPDPNGQRHSELPLARHFIDLLAVLEEKTRGNLSQQESRLLTSALHELRMQFVEQTRRKA